MKHVGSVTATAADGTTGPHPAGLARVGPLIQVALTVPEAAGKAMLASGMKLPQVAVKLLIDTGASITSVHDDVIQQLGLAPIRMQAVRGVSDKAEDYPVYRRTVLIVVQDAANRGVLSLETDVVGMPAAASHPEMRGLLGRDFLRHTRLVYDGPRATFELSDGYGVGGAPMNRVEKRRADRESDKKGGR